MERMGHRFLETGNFQPTEEEQDMDIVEDIDKYICRVSDDMSDRFYEMKDIMQEANHDISHEQYHDLKKKMAQIRHIAEILSLNAWELREKVHQARCISKNLPCSTYINF